MALLLHHCIDSIAVIAVTGPHPQPTPAPSPFSCVLILKIPNASLITIPWKTGVLRWVALWLYKETATVIFTELTGGKYFPKSEIDQIADGEKIMCWLGLCVNG